MRRLYKQNLILSLIVSVTLTVASVLLVNTLLHWMRTPEDIYEYARQYLTIIFFGITGSMLYNYVAQNYGAKEYGRIRLGVRQCVWITIGMSVVLGLVMVFGGRALAAIFVGWDQTEILSMSHEFLTVHGVLYIILALLFDWRYALQGMGNTKVVVAGRLMELLMRAVSAFWLVPSLGFFGACIETPLSWIGALLPVVIVWFITVKKMGKGPGTGQLVPE